MLHIWTAEPDLWSGGAEEDLADYETWCAELVVWAAMAAGQDGPPPAAPGRGERIEVADWRKSSRSSHNGQCIEAGTGDAVVGVRDSTDRGGPALTFAPDAWRAFTAALKAERAAPR